MIKKIFLPFHKSVFFFLVITWCSVVHPLWFGVKRCPKASCKLLCSTADIGNIIVQKNLHSRKIPLAICAWFPLKGACNIWIRRAIQDCQIRDPPVSNGNNILGVTCWTSVPDYNGTDQALNARSNKEAMLNDNLVSVVLQQSPHVGLVKILKW